MVPSLRRPEFYLRIQQNKLLRLYQAIAYPVIPLYLPRVQSGGLRPVQHSYRKDPAATTDRAKPAFIVVF